MTPRFPAILLIPATVALTLPLFMEMLRRPYMEFWIGSVVVGVILGWCGYTTRCVAVSDPACIDP